MVIIEEDVIQEGQGTDFKNRNRLGLKSTIMENISPKMQLDKTEANNQAHKPSLNLPCLQTKYFDPNIYADPPSASEPPSAYMKASELGSSLLRDDPLKNLESPTFLSLRRLNAKSS